jgi:hypothetical protein
MQFGGDGVAQLVPALLELGEAFALELSGDLVEVDAVAPAPRLELGTCRLTEGLS